MRVFEEYQRKLVSAEEAVKLVKDGDWVDYSQTCSFPEALDEALAARKGELQDIKVRNAIAMKPIQVVEQDPTHETFTYNAWHCSGLDRKYVDRGWAYYSPMLFRDCGSYYSRGYAPVNVAMVSVSPMDPYGYFSYGLTNCCMQEMLDAAEHIILEVNEHMPVIYGMEGDHIHISQVDYVVEGHRDICLAPGGDAGEIGGGQHRHGALRRGVGAQQGIGAQLVGVVADHVRLHGSRVQSGVLSLQLRRRVHFLPSAAAGGEQEHQHWCKKQRFSHGSFLLFSPPVL